MPSQGIAAPYHDSVSGVDTAMASAENADAAHVSAAIDLVSDSSQPDELDAVNSQQEHETSLQSCPVCGLWWSKGTRPTTMYQHVNACLQQQLV